MASASNSLPSSSALLAHTLPSKTATTHSSLCSSVSISYIALEIDQPRTSIIGSLTASGSSSSSSSSSLVWRLHATHSQRPAAKSSKKVERAFAEHLAGEDDFENEEEEDNNLQLLFQLVRNFIRKISSKATRIARAILPPALSTDLVAFFVNGVVLLSALWISKAFLEVICAVGSAIFLILLVIRSVWSVFMYMESQNRASEMHDTETEGEQKQNPNFMVRGAPA